MSDSDNSKQLGRVAVELQPGFKGFVAAVVNAQYKQKAVLNVHRVGGGQEAFAVFEGQGTRVHMKHTLNNRPYWSFGPFDFRATLYITISHQAGGHYVDSKVVGPLSITKAPESDYPLRFYQSTVISEDGQDLSHDDCTVTVLQYK